KHLPVRLVVHFPNHTPTREMFCRRDGPTRERLPSAFTPRGRAVVVVWVAVIKDEQRSNVKRLEGRDQSIVFGKIIVAAFVLSNVPFEIHSHPAKTGVGDHFDFAGLRIREMNVYTQAVCEILRIRAWRPGVAAISGDTVSGNREREEGREAEQSESQLHQSRPFI